MKTGKVTKIRVTRDRKTTHVRIPAKDILTKQTMTEIEKYVEVTWLTKATEEVLNRQVKRMVII